jgi:hypothetical protein
MDAPNKVPGRMTALEELLHGELGFCELRIEGRIHAAPQISQYICGQIFRTNHGWNRRGNLAQLAVFGNGHTWLAAALADAGKCAQCGHVARPKLPPIRQHRRQSCSDFVGAQAQ